MTGLGYFLFIAAGIVLYVFEIVWFFRWWGDIGAVIGVFVPPAALIFPFLYLLKEGFSTLYFGFWAVAIIGLVIVASTRGDRKPPKRASSAGADEKKSQTIGQKLSALEDD